MVGHSQPDEFELIARYFRPLAEKEKGAAGLKDDAAVLPVKEGCRLVVTMDTLVSGVHFLDFTPPHFIAAKALRVNLSDLASMGANPAYYTLSLSLPTHSEVPYDDDWLDRFSQALGVEQDMYGLTLVGGDTVSTPGPFTITITAFGWVKPGQDVNRSGASAGDLVYVSGTVGDAVLGLGAVRGAYGHLPPASLELITERYQRPQPRLDLGEKIFGLASASIDISDGLVQDLGHICEASNVEATLRAGDLPLSDTARTLLKDDPDLINVLLTGGDDYELLLTVPPEWSGTMTEVSKNLNLQLTQIGTIEVKNKLAERDKVRVFDEAGEVIDLPITGFRHFRG